MVEFAKLITRFPLKRGITRGAAATRCAQQGAGAASGPGKCNAERSGFRPVRHHSSRDRGRGSPLVRSFARWLLLGFALAAGACAYTEYRPSLERYRQIGSGAELRGDLAAAEQAYSEALQITREGQLGDHLEMVSLYELGRVKRNLGKLAESEQLLHQSLELDAKLSTAYGRPWGAPTGYILAELAATYLEAGKLAEGIALLDRLEPIAGQYKDKHTERTFIRQVFTRYARALAERGDEPNARRFTAVAASL